MFFQKAKKLFDQAVKQKKKFVKPNDFAHIATSILSESDIHQHFSSDTINEFLCRKQFPPHYYHKLNFSDVPFTLFAHEQFFLDVYFWRNSDTNVHDHHFTGAFKMMTGSQRQIEFSYKQEKKILPFLDQGDFTIKKTFDMKPGDTQSLLLGKDFIHQTIHDQKSLTANLCLRTPTFPKLHLNSYFLHGYRLKMPHYSDDRIRKLSLISALSPKDQAKHLPIFLGELRLQELVTLVRGESGTRKLMTPSFQALTLEHIQKAHPKAWPPLEIFFNNLAKHDKMHKKLSYFTNL